ncbi:hypothetical protein ABIC83_002689 [Roseateles asaccharophilus]|uniref:DUF5710 domain-containing protein n=1 Tax=Roseateles asaccharophilus TaxID=582607 RepID=UPI0038392BBD
MKAFFGWDWPAWNRGREVGVEWDSASLQNGHSLFIGRPGSGKTYQLNRFIRAFRDGNDQARVHILDVHDDLAIEGASEVIFSQSTPYGLNPLVVGADPHFGGVHKCINNFIRTVNKVTGNLGARQQPLLRNLLLDVYRLRGFDPEDHRTWEVDPHHAHLLSDGSDGRLYLRIPFEEKEEARSVANISWDRNMRAPGYESGCWWIKESEYTGAITRWLPATAGRMHPTLDDVIMFAKRQMMIAFMGSDQAAVTALEAFVKASRAHYKAELAQLRSGGVNRPDRVEESSSEKERKGSKAMEAFGQYLDRVRTGDEIENILKYDKADFKSVIDRLESLRASGIFKAQLPPFDPRARIWRYRIRALEREEKRLFVLFRLRELYNEAVQRGEVSGLRDIIVVDEAHLYADEDGEDMLSVLAREARKFGVAVIAANQTPELPKDFIASLGTKVVLGVASEFNPLAISKMGMTKELLAWIQPKMTLAIQMQDSSRQSGEWRQVVLRKPVRSGQGNQAAAAAA